MEEIKIPSGNRLIDRILKSSDSGVGEWQTSEVIVFLIEKYNELIKQINELKKGE